MLRLKYTSKEIAKLSELYQKYHALPEHNFCKADVVKTWNAIRAIEDKVENKAIEYYREHLTELESDILGEFEFMLITTANNNPDYEFADLWFSMKIADLALFLNLSDDRENIENKLKKIYDERKNVIGTERAVALIERANKERGSRNVATRRPVAYISPNSKVSNEIFRKDNDCFYRSFQSLAVEAQERKKGKKVARQITTSTFLSYNNDKEININKHLTNFDKIVHDAVVTQYINGGNRHITTEMIAFVISGGKDFPHSLKLRKAINASMDKLFHTDIEIKADEQKKPYGLSNCRLKGHILDFRLVGATINGQDYQCMEMADEKPILYEYASALGQVIQTDLKMLNIHGLENNTKNIELKHYLLHRVEIMLYNPNQSTIIRYDAIYDLLGIEAINEDTLRTKKRDIRKKVKICLDYWIKTGKERSKEGRIIDYKEIKTGKEITKVQLYLKYPEKDRKNSQKILNK